MASPYNINKIYRATIPAPGVTLQVDFISPDGDYLDAIMTIVPLVGGAASISVDGALLSLIYPLPVRVRAGAKIIVSDVYITLEPANVQ